MARCMDMSQATKDKADKDKDTDVLDKGKLPGDMDKLSKI
jgi:hypothetical protein